jgi:glucosamine-6-phosphate deaminase
LDLVVLDDAEAAAGHVAGLILDAVSREPDLVLGVATGAAPLPVYRALARGRGAFARVRLVALDEYVGLRPGTPRRTPPTSCARSRLRSASQRGMSWCPRGAGPELARRVADLGGVDLQLLGIGRNGHLAFNEPGSPLDSRTRVVELTESTRVANAPYVDGPVPTHAVRQGLGTILEASELVLLATAAAKAAAVAAALTGPVTTECPASVLQRHRRVSVVLDAAAASVMTAWKASHAPSARAWPSRPPPSRSGT